MIAYRAVCFTDENHITLQYNVKYHSFIVYFCKKRLIEAVDMV